MKCRFCEFETEAINSDDVNVEMHKHFDDMHGKETVPVPMVIDMMRISYEYEVPIDEVIDLYFEARKKVAQRDRWRNPS